MGREAFSKFRFGSRSKMFGNRCAKWCHKKLLDSAKSLVTSFQLKSAESSEILLKICYS